MRAIYVKDLLGKPLQQGEKYILDGENANHLAKVLRTRTNDSILLLDGNGSKYLSNVIKIEKREVVVEVQTIELVQRKYNIELALGTPKRTAFEQILTVATESGYHTIIPLISEFSQKISLSQKRDNRLILSATNQSNNPFLMRRSDPISINLFDFDKYDHVFYFCSHDRLSNQACLNLSSSQLGERKILIVIGPEAGFSENEERKMLALKNIELVHLATPILRSPTAVSASMGYLMGLIQAR